MEGTLGPGSRSTSVPQLLHGPFLDLVCQLCELIRLTLSAELNALPLAVPVEEHHPTIPLFYEGPQSRRALELRQEHVEGIPQRLFHETRLPVGYAAHVRGMTVVRCRPAKPMGVRV